MENYSFVIIGGGSAGFTLAVRLAREGHKTALVEKGPLGGTCPNIGCIPSKDLIHAAKVAEYARRGKDYGFKEAAAGKVDLALIVAKKNELVQRMLKHAHRAVADIEALTLIEAEAHFQSPGIIRVGDREIKGERIIIGTGARPLLPSVKGLEETGCLTSTTIMELGEVPESLVILGGGTVAVEFAQMFARFGSRVTVLQRSNRLIPHVEEEAGRELLKVLRQEGVKVFFGAKARGVSRDGESTRITVDLEGKEEIFTAEKLLAATGRKPNTDGLHLDKAGIELDEKGFIKVDSSLKTAVDSHWAMGDVTGPPMYTHTARHDAYLLSRYFNQGEAFSLENRIVPFTIFTDPEIAAVGLTEAEARRQGFASGTIFYPLRFLGRAQAMKETAGFIKLIYEEGTEKLLGALIMAPHAGDLIHELVMALRFGAVLEDLREMIHVHPTLNEGINFAALTRR